MNADCHLTLCLPGFTHPGFPEHIPSSLPSLKALQTLRRFGSRVALPLSTGELWARYLLSGSLKALALADLGLSPDTPALLAAPLMQRMDLHHAEVAALGLLDINLAAAHAAVAHLTPWLRQDGLALEVWQPHLWVLILPAPLADFAAPAVWDIVGRMTQTHKPQGQDAATVLRWQTEWQMLLHEAAPSRPSDSAVINGIWLWPDSVGGLTLPAATASPYRHWFDGMTEAFDVPADFHAWQSTLQSRLETPSTQIVWLENAWPSQRFHDFDAHACAWKTLEHDFLAPALVALKRGQLGRLSVVSDGAHGAVLSLTRNQLRHFWRRPRPFQGAL